MLLHTFTADNYLALNISYSLCRWMDDVVKDIALRDLKKILTAISALLAARKRAHVQNKCLPLSRVFKKHFGQFIRKSHLGWNQLHT